MPVVTVPVTQILTVEDALIYVCRKLAAGETIDEVRAECVAAVARTTPPTPDTRRNVSLIRVALDVVEDTATTPLTVPVQRTHGLYS